MTDYYSYSDIDYIPEDMLMVEIETDKETGEAIGFKKPKKKKWSVEHNGMQFEVVSKVQRDLAEIWEGEYAQHDEGELEEYYCEYYDPSTLLEMCGDYNIPAEGYIHDGTGVHIDNPIASLFLTSSGFIGKERIEIESLDYDVAKKRINAFVHILMRCCDEDVAREIVERAEKKKNGTLHKGRLLKIAHLNLTMEEGATYVVVAKNDSDTKISIEVRIEGINTTWFHEPDMFTSTDLFVNQ